MALNFNDINVNNDYDYLCLYAKNKRDLKPIMQSIFRMHVDGLPIFDYNPKLTETADELQYKFLNTSTVVVKFVDEKSIEIVIDFFYKHDGNMTVIDYSTYYETLVAHIFRGIKKIEKILRVRKITYVDRDFAGYTLNASTHCNVDILKLLDFSNVLRVHDEQTLRSVFKNHRFVSYCATKHIGFSMYNKSAYSLNKIMPLESYIFDQDAKTFLIYLKHK